MKANIEDLNKEKNSLNVALRSAKQDIKAQSKISEKKMSEYEKKIHDLNEFRIRKLNEERQEKMRKKKELKKEAKKIRGNNNSTGNGDLVLKGKDANENTLQKDSVVEENEKESPREIQSCSLKLHNCDKIPPCLPQQATLSASESIISDGVEKASEDRYMNVELEEKEEGFIGPRVPRMLTDEEVKAIFDKLLGDKYG